MNETDTFAFVSAAWDETIIPTLEKYIAIPAKSPMFDSAWEENGHLDKAMELIASWCRERPIRGMELEVVRLPGLTPVLVMDIPGTEPNAETVLLYGHMDKQPEMAGWRDGLGPWTPVIEDGKLYGRGGADDGYAAFAALTAIEAVQRAGGSHARCVVLIEGSEESGSSDLPQYMEHLEDRIGTPSLVVCLDSGAGDYERLWCTTSLRGVIVGNLFVDVLSEGVHSGAGSGIVASSFRIARNLLDRLENSGTGEIIGSTFNQTVPPDRMKQVEAMADVLGDRVWKDFPVVSGMQPLTLDPVELILNNTWRSALSVVGAEGFADLKNAGNVLRPQTALKLSLRIPPGVDAEAAAAHLKHTLEADPPYGATVRFDIEGPGDGWNAPPFSPWLENSLQEASKTYFHKEACWMGEGGSIPFMAMLGERFPRAQFVITGLLGPGSNAHGPNEFLHIEAAKKLTACVAHVLAAHQSSPREAAAH